VKRGALFALPVVSATMIWLSSPGGGELSSLSLAMLVPLLCGLARQTKAKRAFFSGWLCGFAAYLALLYWIVFVLGHYGGLPWFIATPLLMLLTAYMALYTGLFALGFWFLPRSRPTLCLLVAPALWVGLDWLRGLLFTGFPWMDVGYFLAFSPWLIQSADLFGHHGITFLIVMTNVFLYLRFFNPRFAGDSRRQGQFDEARFTRAIPGTQRMFASFLVAVLLYSGASFYFFDTASDPSLRIGVVQGNISQDVKWSPENRQATLDGYLRQSAALSAAEHPPDLLLWPETALPFYPQRSPLTPTLLAFVGQSNTPILTGAPWFELDAAAPDGARRYNGALLLTPEAGFAATYFKSHLVPFGEYVPLRQYLPFIAPLVETVGQFSAGQVKSPMFLANKNARLPANIGILICYESVFPDIARRWVNVGANVLVNLTNDAWYGRSSAPRHSLAMAILRAVETRRALVRAANTGYSAFIDPSGRARDISPLFAPWAENGDAVLRGGRTGYVLCGYLFAPLCLLCSSLALLLVWRRNSR
jgi:apolipoprotein N-acyltransferase